MHTNNLSLLVALSRIVLCLILNLGVIFSFTGCKKEKKSSTKSLHFDSKNPHLLKLYLQTEPLSLDPRVGGNRTSQIFIRELFEGLTRIGIDGKPYPAQAKTISISPDGKTYTFVLRETCWSNGEKVTAYDFENGWKSLLEPSFNTMYAYAFYSIKGAKAAKLGTGSMSDVGIKALDECTLVVELNHPAPYFLEFLANPLFSPISKQQLAHKEQQTHTSNYTLISNGPFCLHKWLAHQEFQLIKNDTYYDAKNVKIEGMKVSIVPDAETALSLFESGELDMVGDPFGTLSFEATAKFIQENRLKIGHNGALYWLQVNTQNTLLSSKKIRKALCLAISRKEITDTLLQAGERPAFSLLPDELSLTNEPLFSDGDVETAKKLFQEGLNELGLTQELIPPLVITYWAEAKERSIAQIVAATWTKTLGIPTSLTSCDWPSFLRKITSQDYDIAGTSWYSWYQDPIYNLEFIKFTTGTLNGTGWQNSRYIELLDKSDHAKCPQERYTFLKEAEKLAMNEMPLIPLFSQTYKFLQKPHIKGVWVTPTGAIEIKDAYIVQQEKPLRPTKE